MILEARKKHLSEIVNLHRELIRGASSSMFGYQFVYSLYKTAIETPKTHMWIAKKEGEVVGFICITEDMRFLTKEIRKSFNLNNLWTIFAQLVSEPKRAFIFLNRVIFDIKLMLRIKHYPNILSIAVDRRIQSAGFGKKLMDTAENYFKRRKFTRYYVDAELSNEKAVAFYKKLGFKIFYASNGNVCLVKINPKLSNTV